MRPISFLATATIARFLPARFDHPEWHGRNVRNTGGRGSSQPADLPDRSAIR